MKTNLGKTKAFLIIIIKSLVVCLSLYFIYHRVFVSQDFEEFESAFKNALSGNFFFPLFILVFVLFIINWGAEAFKWKMSMYKLQSVSYAQSFKAVFSGITVGLFTPNRIGEYGGRIIYVNKDKRIDAIVSTIAGNASQLLITVVFGILAVFYFLDFSLVMTQFNFLFLLFLIPLIFYLFFKIQKIPTLLGNKGGKYLKAFSLFNRKELIKLILLSSLRYLMFFLQFYILLLIFNIELQLTDALVLLPSVFLVITVVPSFALAEWGVRGSAALFFINTVSANSAGILAAATVLWIINIALPALIGAVFITKHKLSLNEC